MKATPVKRIKESDIEWYDLCKYCKTKYKLKCKTEHAVIVHFVKKHNDNLPALAEFFGVSYHAMRRKLMREKLYDSHVQPNNLAKLREVDPGQLENMTSKDIGVLLGVTPTCACRIAKRGNLKYKKLSVNVRRAS